MASLKLKYEALTLELKNQTQVFTGNTVIDCWHQADEFNDWLAKGKNIRTMYKIVILERHA